MFMTHFCLSGIQQAMKAIGDVCDPEDTCAYDGRCLSRCCHPHLAMPDNVAECDQEGWQAKCKSGHEWVSGKGCTKKEDLDSSPWTTHVGLDCYQGKGGEPISPDPLSSSMSVVECKAACLRDSTCEGVVTRSGQNVGYCYKRSGLTLQNCVRDSDWTLHERRGGM